MNPPFTNRANMGEKFPEGNARQALRDRADFNGAVDSFKSRPQN